MYVVLPNFSWWERQNYTDARKMPENFVYTSDNNDEWLSVEELREIVFGDDASTAHDSQAVAVSG